MDFRTLHSLQNTTIEHKFPMRDGNANYFIEAAGDIYRELTKYEDGEGDGGYIFEKLFKLEKFEKMNQADIEQTNQELHRGASTIEKIVEFIKKVEHLKAETGKIPASKRRQKMLMALEITTAIASWSTDAYAGYGWQSYPKSQKVIGNIKKLKELLVPDFEYPAASEMTLDEIESIVSKMHPNSNNYALSILKWIKHNENPNDPQNTEIVFEYFKKELYKLQNFTKEVTEKKLDKKPEISSIVEEYIALAALMNKYDEWIKSKEQPADEYFLSNEILEPEYYTRNLKTALDNLKKTSRTAKGEINTEASDNKAAAIIAQSEMQIAERAQINFNNTLKYLYSQRSISFFEWTEDQLLAWVDDINKRINEGIVKLGTLLRTEDSDKFPYTKVADLPKARKLFAKYFLRRKGINPKFARYDAAWIIWRINFTDHFYADGCGKTADALSYFILFRNDQDFPIYPESRKEWFRFANKTVREAEHNSEYLGSDYKMWEFYYRTLFPDYVEPELETKNIPIMNTKGKPGEIRPAFLKSKMHLGRKIEILMPNNEKRQAQFALVDLADILASHNEENFASTEGYPTNDLGHNINDRNYAADKNAQKLVMDWAADLQAPRLVTTSRTPSGTPIISPDGFVVSGNNRIMSMKLAVKQYPPKYEQYLHFLKEECGSFGFQQGVCEDNMYYGLQHPVLVRIDYDFPEYNTEELAKYNKDTKKSERPIDKVIKLSNILRENQGCFETIGNIVEKYETFSEFYANQADQKKMINAFLQCNLVAQQELPAFYDGNLFTDAGKDFLEAILVSMVLEKDALISSGQPGVKSFRQHIITSLPVLVANASLPEGSLRNKLNKAIVLQYQIVQSGLEFDKFIGQPQLFSEPWPRKAVIINRLLSRGRNIFKGAIEKYNTSVKGSSGPSMFEEVKLTIDEIFEGYITKQLLPDDQAAIEKSPIIEKTAKQAEAKTCDLFFMADDEKQAQLFIMYLDNTSYEHNHKEDEGICFYVIDKEDALITMNEIEKTVVKRYGLQGHWLFEGEPILTGTELVEVPEITDEYLFELWNEYVTKFPTQRNHPDFLTWGKEKNLSEIVIDGLYAFNYNVAKAPEVNSMLIYNVQTLDELKRTVKEIQEKDLSEQPARAENLKKMGLWKFTPEEAAIDFIKPYAIRGDSLKSLKDGQGGVWSINHVQIGGYVNKKKYSTDKIIVLGVNNEEIDPVIFNLKDIYEKSLLEKPKKKTEIVTVENLNFRPELYIKFLKQTAKEWANQGLNYLDWTVALDGFLDDRNPFSPRPKGAVEHNKWLQQQIDILQSKGYKSNLLDVWNEVNPDKKATTDLSIEREETEKILNSYGYKIGDKATYECHDHVISDARKNVVGLKQNAKDAVVLDVQLPDFLLWQMGMLCKAKDLKGNTKEPWMLTREQFKKFEFQKKQIYLFSPAFITNKHRAENKKITNVGYQLPDTKATRNQFIEYAYRDLIRSALGEEFTKWTKPTEIHDQFGKRLKDCDYMPAIKAGKMTAFDAHYIIAMAGIEVPQGIMQLYEKELEIYSKPKVQHPASSIQLPVTSSQHPATSIQQPATTLDDPATYYRKLKDKIGIFQILLDNAAGEKKKIIRQKLVIFRNLAELAKQKLQDEKKSGKTLITGGQVMHFKITDKTKIFTKTNGSKVWGEFIDYDSANDPILADGEWRIRIDTGGNMPYTYDLPEYIQITSKVEAEKFAEKIANGQNIDTMVEFEPGGTLPRTKIGQGYMRAGHNHESVAHPLIYLINGYAYAKDKYTWERDFEPLQGDLEGYVRVNAIHLGDVVRFAQVSTNDKHIPYNQETKAQGGAIFTADEQQTIKQSEDLGRLAFLAGLTSVPIHDKEFYQLLVKNKRAIGDPLNIAMLDAWTNGWHRANMMKPIPEN